MASTTWWGTPQHVQQGRKAEAAAMAAAAAVPSLGAAPIDLLVGDRSIAASGRQVLAEGLRSLYERSELCDVVLIAGGERLPAHSVVLAAESDNFRRFLLHRNGKLNNGEDPMKGVLAVPTPAKEEKATTPVEADAAAPVAEPKTEGETQPPVEQPAPPAEGIAPQEPVPVAAAVIPAEKESVPEVKEEEKKPSGGPMELEVTGIATAEAVKLMLGYTYFACMGASWEYQPETSEVNKDVLRLARHFGLPHLHEHAARWLAQGLTTANVVGRIVTCEEFGLNLLRESIVERLTQTPNLLMMVSSSPEIMQHPHILQDLLVQVATLHDRPRKAKAAEVSIKESPKPEEVVAKEKQEEKREEKPIIEKPPAKRTKRAAGA